MIYARLIAAFNYVYKISAHEMYQRSSELERLREREIEWDSENTTTFQCDEQRANSNKLKITTDEWEEKLKWHTKPI